MLLLLTLLVVVLNLLLGLVAFRKNPKSATSRLFLILSIVLSLWAITNYFSVVTTNKAQIFFWLKAVMFVTGAMFSTIYLLVKAFPGKSVNLSNKWIIAIVAFTLITQILAAFSFVFKDIQITENGITPIPGIGMPVFAANVFIFLVLAIYTLVKKYKSFKGVEKLQLRFLILGIVLTFTLATVTNFVVVNLFKVTSLVSIGPLFTLILVGSIAYAIIKHKLLDVRTVIARAVSYTLLIAIIAVFYALFFGVLSSLFVTSQIEIKTIAVSTILALIMAFSFQPLRRLLEIVSDKIFFKDRYDSNQFLYSLTSIMASTLELETLGHKLLKTILLEMRISWGVFILVEKGEIFDIISEGYTDTTNIKKDQIAPLLSQKVLVFDDMDESNEKAIMRDLGFIVAIQLRTESGEIGLLALGGKQSGDVYSVEDIKVLEIVAPEAAVAVQNAKSYEQIRRFNVTLQSEVESATKNLQIANDQLHELDKLKSEFVSVASHELRTPMTAIKSYLWMAIAGRGGNITDKQKYYLERAYISTDRLIKLVNDLLNVSRIESGKLAIDMEKMEVPQFMNEVIAEVKPRADELGIKIINEANKTSLPVVLADSDKIKEVVINFLGNSLKFSKQGGEIKIWCDSTPGFVGIHVTDVGEGIDPADLPKLFQKFGLVKGSYVTNQNAAQGTGLGLYISKSIVELHGGTIKAESPGKGKGATFSFTLPIYTEENFAKAQKYKGTEGLGIIHSTID